MISIHACKQLDRSTSPFSSLTQTELESIDFMKREGIPSRLVAVWGGNVSVKGATHSALGVPALTESDAETVVKCISRKIINLINRLKCTTPPSSQFYC